MWSLFTLHGRYSNPSVPASRGNLFDHQNTSTSDSALNVVAFHFDISVEFSRLPHIFGVVQSEYEKLQESLLGKC